MMSRAAVHIDLKVKS